MQTTNNNISHHTPDVKEMIENKLHEHIFRARIAFDYTGEAYAYGLCWCGERDM